MKLKRILASVLAVCTVLSTMSFSVFADDSDSSTTASSDITLGGDIDLSGSGNSAGGGSSEETDAAFTVTLGALLTNVDTLEEALVAYDLWSGNMGILGYPTITMNEDYELTEPIVIDNEYPITIDLNGYELTYDSTVMGEAMITNKGDLTINDSVGTGVINYNYTGENDPDYGKGNYTISNGGTLTVNGGKITIANLRAHAKYPIDNNSTTGDAVLVINGGHLYNYNTSAIRQFCNSTTYENIVTINDGLIEGYCAIWVQNPGSNTVNGSLKITGGEIKTTAAAYVNGTSELKDVASRIYCTTEGGAWDDDSAVIITGGTINENVSLAEEAPANITIGEDAVYNGYVETPVPDVTYVASVGGVEYESVHEAINAAQDGDTVEIYAGEYDPINISNKNITIKGAVGDNGELLTTIKGGNPAITGHSFNGTIKDIKIVDAWKVMYAEPAGNVTIDNIYVTGATYGLHLVAYTTGITWTIQNSYMDLSWANSFGVYNGGYADIIVKDNEFASTDPYYPDYGALAVNTFSPNVTIEGNIFRENAKIFIDDSVTDTSNINVSKNYHADGVDKAFAVDEDGGKTVDIYQYYTAVDADGNLTGLVEIPATPAVTDVIEIYDWEDLKELDAIVEGGNMLEGVTVKLMNDIDLYEMGTDGEPMTFNPIGANKAYFKGTFDGQGYTIKNMYQSGWALGYDWNNYGTIGLFAYLWNATVKNLTIENAECLIEGGNVAAIAGCAWGDCTFENITVKNSTFATYNNRAAGIVGYTGGEGTMTFKDVTVDEDTVIAALWGSYDCTLGGVVGSTQSPTEFVFENLDVSCKLDCYNDVTASYKWYSYRMCGMLIGRMETLQENSTDVDPRGVVTLNNVDITIGEWANQTYIWDDSLSKGCQRVEPGYSYGGVNVEDYPDAEIETLGFNTIIGGPQSQKQGFYGSDITKLEALENFDTTTLEVEDLALAARTPAVAQIGDTKHETLEDAFKAATADCTIEILDDVVIDYKWDCRDYATNGSHSQFKESVTINGNGHTIKFTGTVSDGNWNTIFRFEENATVNNLTIDISEATGAQRVITAKKSLTVDGLTIIGSAKYGIIFGEGASAADLANAEISITNSTLSGTRRAISDNEGGKDVKSATITDNTLNANVYVSAYESITFNNNTTAGEVDLRSYAAENVLSVEAKGNTLNTAVKNYISAKTVDAQPEFVIAFDGENINNLADLKAFRDSVNAGNTYAGKTVVLNADIDLAGIEWTPIGVPVYTTANYILTDNANVFCGAFDGNGKIISNLKIEKQVGGADADANIGLFSGTGEGAVIKNLTITNVDIDTDGRNVGALVGVTYKGTTLENITVNGDIQIVGGNNVSVVGGMMRYASVNATNIKVSGNDGSSITGNNIVGGIFAEIAPKDNNCEFRSLTVENVAINGVGGVGGIVGLLTLGTVSDVTVEDVTLVGKTAWKADENRIRLGSVAGLLGNNWSTISNATVENVTAKNLEGEDVVLPIIGANYDGNIGNATEAKIGDTYYATFALAYAAAQADDTITLLVPVVVGAGETLELNNDVTITYTSDVPGEDMITNRGNLVIDGATLVYTNTDTTATNVTVSTISCEPGSTLTVNSGTVKNDSANNAATQIYAYAIDLVTNGNLGDVTANISGGYVVSTDYMAIRQFVNGEACKNTLTVTDGTITGGTRGINIQLKNNMAYTTISGGTIEGGDYSLCFLTTSENVSVTDGTFTGEVWYSGTEGFITGGTFSTDVTDYCADGFTCEANGDGTYGIVKATDATITAVGATLLYEDMIQIRYKFKVTGDNIAEHGMYIFENSEDAATHDATKAVETKALTGYSDGYYYGYTDGIAAKEMGDSQFMVGYLKLDNGQYVYTNTIEYSPKIYAEYMVKNSTSEATKNLCNALMQYGASAQIYLDYKVDSLMNIGFDPVDYDESVLGTSIFSVDTNEINGFTAKAATLLFEGAITYRIKYGASESISAKTLYLEYTVKGTTDYVEMKLIDGSYYGYISGIAAKDMDEALTAKPYYLDDSGNKVYGAELVYSGYEYARYIIAGSNNTDSVSLAKAFAMYVSAADTAISK